MTDLRKVRFVSVFQLNFVLLSFVSCSRRLVGEKQNGLQQNVTALPDGAVVLTQQ